MPQPKIIRFYLVRDPYGQFSDFSPHPIFLDGTTWRTCEHYFQGQEFLDGEIHRKIQMAASPMVAASFTGR